MPQMGVSVSEGTIVEWRKQVGDWVEYEEAIVDISTDKIDTEVPSPAAGRVAEIVVEVGTTVDVGTVLARLATDAKPGQAHASEQKAAAATGETPVEATATPSPEPGTATPDEAPRARRAAGARRYSPVVQRIAAEHDVDLDRVQGTGREGRVRKQDVLAFIESSGAGTAAVEEPPLHIESPYKPEPPAPKPAAAAPAASAQAPAAAPTEAPAAAAPAQAPAAAAPAAPAPAGAYQPPAAAPLSRMRKLVGEHMKRSLDTAAT